MEFRKKKFKSYFICAFVSFMLFNLCLLSAQNKVISGVVKDEKGEALIGVSIVPMGHSGGAVTDVDGKYTLSVPSSIETLRFSYIGMESQDITIRNRSVVNVIMKESPTDLNTVMVIGYGTVKKGDLTTAVSDVGTKDLDRRPIISADQAIQGKAAGVSVVSPSGTPGQSMVIRVRGASSMNSDNNPLYVVDGVPVTDISFLSANDIESMQVLKDASSQAIYGSRGANGVVMITTKSGKAGVSKISFSTYVGFENLARKIKSLNTEQYKQLLSDMNSSTVIPDNATDQTNWYKETYQTALTQNYQVSLSDGNQKLRYYLSGGYTDQNGIIKVAFFKRYNFKVNVDDQIKKWLKIGTNITYSEWTQNGIITGTGANRGGVILSVINTPTYASVWDSNHAGQYNSNFNGVNITSPVENMARSANNIAKNDRLIATGSAEFTILPELKFKSTVTLDKSHYLYTEFIDPTTTQYGRTSGGEGQDNRSTTTVMVYDNILTYDKQFGKHDLTLMGGTSGTTSQWSESYQTANYYANSNIQTLNAANKISPGNGSYASDWAIMSYLGRASYDYEGKYLLTANIRADGSSKLAPGHRWGYFPSVSGAWRISSEKFLSDVKWLSDMKIRAGWGQSGNQSGLGDYGYLQSYSIIRQNWWATGNSTAVPIITQSSLRNTDLTWETTSQTNLGLDIALFNSRLNFSADAYYKKTSNMLVTVTIPAGASSVSSFTRNEGAMTNKGLEFSVDSKNLTGPLAWNTNFNISFNRNELTKLTLTKVYYACQVSDVLNDYLVRNAPGHPLGSFYGYIADGVDPETGQLKYRDLNGDGKITTSDRAYIGNPNPDFTFGMTNTFSYKGFTLDVLLQGSYGNDIFNASRIETEGMYDGKNQSIRVLDRWRRPGMITQIPKAGYDMKISSYFIENGSYLRVKEMTLSYDFQSNFLRKLGVSRLQPYATATNLLTLTKYLGFDPEVNQFGNSGTVQGVDWGTYPQTRSFVFGVNIDF